MAGSVEELLDLLYTEIEEAKNAPLNNDRCVIERDRVLDMIDDVKAELPVEIKRAKDLVANRNDYIASAKREADSLRQQAEDYAKRLVNEDAIVREAEKKADEILSDAEEQCRMLKAAASEYCEDTLRRMEEAVADAYDEVKHSRAKFRSALSAASGGPAPRSQPAPRRAMYDAEADEKRPPVGGLFFCAWGNQSSGGRTPLSLMTRVSPARRTVSPLGMSTSPPRRTRMIRRVPVDRVDRGRSSQGSPVSRVRS